MLGAVASLGHAQLPTTAASSAQCVYSRRVNSSPPVPSWLASVRLNEGAAHAANGGFARARSGAYVRIAPQDGGMSHCSPWNWPTSRADDDVRQPDPDRRFHRVRHDQAGCRPCRHRFHRWRRPHLHTGHEHRDACRSRQAGRRVVAQLQHDPRRDARLRQLAALGRGDRDRFEDDARHQPRLDPVRPGTGRGSQPAGRGGGEPISGNVLPGGLRAAGAT